MHIQNECAKAPTCSSICYDHSSSRYVHDEEPHSIDESKYWTLDDGCNSLLGLNQFLKVPYEIKNPIYSSGK